MASEILQALADPIYVAKFQRLCGVILEKPEKIDQQTQTRIQPSDSDSSDHDERSHVMSSSHPHIDDRCNNESVDCISANANKEKNNNLSKTSHDNENITDSSNKTHSKKVHKKKAYTIEPTNRIYGKGSIFDCDTDSTKDSNKENSPTNTDTSSLGYQIKYRPLLYIAYFGAFLGNEEFYLTFFPFCIWNVDFLLVRQVSMLWAVVMYLGQATKDYFRWPRRPCPPVVRLETSYLQEFAMPSTHAMAGTAIPLYMAYLAVERYQVPVPVAAGIAVTWFVTTCFSRLYLGVHSFLDLIVGFLYATLVLFTFLRYVEDYDYYQQTHPFAIPAILVATIMLCTVCYPDNHKISSKGDAVQIVSALAGQTIGAWLGHELGYYNEPLVAGPYSIHMPTLQWLGLSVLRFVVGLVVVGIIYVSVRFASISGFSWLYGLDRPDKTNPSVNTSYKFTTYMIVGAAITILVPLIHLQLGIQRDSFFFEVS